MILNSLLVREAVSRLPKGSMRVAKLLATTAPEKREFRLTGKTDVRMLLDTSDVFQAHMAFGTYQRKLLSVLGHHARRGDNVLVAGAHVGYIPLRLAELGCKVVACEADPRNVEQSRHNFSLNPQLAIELAGVGLSDAPTELLIWMADASSNSSLAFAHHAHAQAKVVVRPADQILQEFGIGELDGLVLDVEGWEVKALSGLKETLHRSRPRWAVIECAPWALEGAGTSERELRNLIQQIGWNDVRQVGDDLICT